MTYLLNARAIYLGQIFNGEVLSTHYPPLYSFLISPAFLAGNSILHNVQLLNAVYSSLSVVLTFLILRLQLNQKFSFVGALTSALLPFHLFIPRQAFSENIYVPLLLFTVYMSIKPSDMSYKRTLLFGLMITALFLTRYITLVILPVLILFWLLRNFEGNKYSIVLRHLIILLSTLFVFYGLWVLYGVLNGVPVGGMLGFHITENTKPEYLTMERFIYFSIKVACYSVLLSGPFLFPVVVYYWNNFPRSIFDRHDTGRFFRLYHSFSPKTQLLFLFSGITASFWVAITRHYWRAMYNIPNVSKFSSRYFAYLVPLVFILAWFGVGELKSKKTKLLILYTTAICCLVPSYLLIFNGHFTRVPFIPQIIRRLTSLDITLYLGDYRLWYLAGLVLLPVTLLFRRDRHKVIYTTLIVVHMTILLAVSYQNLGDLTPKPYNLEWQIAEFGEIPP